MTSSSQGSHEKCCSEWTTSASCASLLGDTGQGVLEDGEARRLLEIIAVCLRPKGSACRRGKGKDRSVLLASAFPGVYLGRYQHANLPKPAAKACCKRQRVRCGQRRPSSPCLRCASLRRRWWRRWLPLDEQVDNASLWKPGLCAYIDGGSFSSWQQQEALQAIKVHNILLAHHIISTPIPNAQGHWMRRPLRRALLQQRFLPGSDPSSKALLACVCHSCSTPRRPTSLGSARQSQQPQPQAHPPHLLQAKSLMAPVHRLSVPIRGPRAPQIGKCLQSELAMV